MVIEPAAVAAVISLPSSAIDASSHRANRLRVASLHRAANVRGPKDSCDRGACCSRSRSGVGARTARRTVPPCVSGSGPDEPDAIAAPAVTADRRRARIVSELAKQTNIVVR
jgi:hypothetical protein